jgi:hypothetical protein
MSLTKCLHQSNQGILFQYFLLLTTHTCRQRREHRIFKVLLQMVPNLEARLMEGSEDDVVCIAEMVGLFFCSFTISAHRFGTASERCLQRQIRRYKKSEGPHP